MHFLGIDSGTSAVKAILVDSNQNIVAESSVGLETSRPYPLWSEQSPDLWWEAVCTALRDISQKAPPEYRNVRAIGLSGQMHGAVFIDRDNSPLRPAILWNDGRSHAQASTFQNEYPELAEKLGVLPMPGFTAPKLAWIRENEPQIYEKTDCILLPKDYIRLKLTGERVSDMSDAAGAWLLDEEKRQWSAEAAKVVGIKPYQLPRLVEGSEISGILLPETAQELGLPEGVIVAGGAGDSPAGSIGTGLVSEGTGMLNLGTSALMLIPTSSYRPAVDKMVHSFCHALPGMWYQMAAMLNGASAFSWVAQLTGENVGELSARVESEFNGPGKLDFLPYLAGERTPHNNPHAKGVFFGLTPATDKTQLAQSVMEGVALSFADARDCLEESGSNVPALSIMGGGSKSIVWCRIIADVLNRPIIRHKGGNLGPAFGAARLARLAATGEDPKSVCTPPEVEEVIEPSEFSSAYAGKVEKFRRIYRKLREEF